MCPQEHLNSENDLEDQTDFKNIQNDASVTVFYPLFDLLNNCFNVINITILVTLITNCSSIF